MQLFIPRLKVQKDRKLMRQVDQNLVRRCLLIVPSYFAVFFITLLLGDFYTEQPVLASIIGFLLLASCVIQLALMIKFERIYPKAPSRWRNQFLFTILSIVFIWAGFHVINAWHFKAFSAVTLGTIFLVILGAWGTIVFAPYLRLLRSYLGILFVAALLPVFFMRTLQDIAATTLLVFFYGFLLIESKRIYFAYWNRLETNFDLKRKTVDLETARREADFANRVKNEFLDSMSHEIKTPLNSVLGMLSLLGDTELSQVQKQFQSVAMRSGETLLNLINDVLDYSQLTASTLQLQKTVFDLRAMIEDVIEVMGSFAHENSIELCCTFDPHIPTRVSGDAARLTQVITNLLSNAIKFSNKGEVIVFVHLERVGKDKGLLRIEVVDEGVGMSADQKEIVFGAFSRVDSSSTREQGGTGLGLTISKGLIELMEGTMGVESEPGKGSTFWFTAALDISSQQTNQFKLHKELEGMKVLIVMPEKLLARSISAELNSWGLIAEHVDDAKQALQVLRGVAREGIHYRFVIINMDLKGIDCFNLSTTIAEDPKLKETNQIILTSLVQRGSEKAFLHLNKVSNLHYLTKPVRHNLLHEALLFLSGIHQETMLDQEITMPEDMDMGRVLLVEDNRVNQLVASNMLKNLGYGVKIANNGKEALGIIADHEFDLVLMDCQMPEMDGYDTTKEIRRREENTHVHIPIVAMTANTMEGDEAKCLASGMDDYLPKPVKTEELENKLRCWVNSSPHMKYAESESSFFK